MRSLLGRITARYVGCDYSGCLGRYDYAFFSIINLIAIINTARDGSHQHAWACKALCCPLTLLHSNLFGHLAVQPTSQSLSFTNNYTTIIVILMVLTVVII